MPEINDFKNQTVVLRENRSMTRSRFLFGQKVGQDILFTKRQQSTITPSYDRHTFWFLAGVTISFVIAQSLLILFGR